MIQRERKNIEIKREGEKEGKQHTVLLDVVHFLHLFAMVADGYRENPLH